MTKFYIQPTPPGFDATYRVPVEGSSDGTTGGSATLAEILALGGGGTGNTSVVTVAADGTVTHDDGTGTTTTFKVPTSGATFPTTNLTDGQLHALKGHASLADGVYYLADAAGPTWIRLIGSGSGGSGGSTTFIGLSDTPGSLGTAGQMPVVNATGTALEFVTPAAVTDTNDTSVVTVAADGTVTHNDGAGVITTFKVHTSGATFPATNLVTGQMHSLVGHASLADGVYYLADAAGTTWIRLIGSGGGGGGSTTFIGLSDTPGSLGTPGQMPVVNAAGTALEFVTPAAVTDTNDTSVVTAGADGVMTHDDGTGNVTTWRIPTLGAAFPTTNLVNGQMHSLVGHATIPDSEYRLADAATQNWVRLG